MNMWIRSVFAVSAFSLTGLSPPPATAQGADLLSDPTVIALAEEALIADLMLRSCAGIVGSDTGAAEVRALADELARQFGHTPETAAARLSQPDSLKRIEQGARQRLAMMGARPEDLGALCALARQAASGPGLIGAALDPSP